MQIKDCVGKQVCICHIYGYIIGELFFDFKYKIKVGGLNMSENSAAIFFYENDVQFFKIGRDNIPIFKIKPL